MTNLPATLITGAATRIGRAIALDLAKTGTPNCVHYNSSAGAAEALVAEIQEAGGTAVAVAANLLDDVAVMGLVERASDALGAPIGLLVNNASLFDKDEVGSLTPALFDQHFAIHAKAPALLADQMVNALPDGAEALIVNIIDQRVWRLTPYFPSYTASKAALWTLTQTLAQAYAETTQGRVRVNAIGPGPTLVNERQDPSDFANQVAGVPLGRPPGLEEFAATIKHFWAAKSVTGQMIALDGGQHLSWQTPDVMLANE
ncbi:MAG: SDR family oxidoreductase [Devosiaceae bacterium]|nr:SDR family oxidoreductase [Devosiaceae bacterium MH13]